jgi:hypothetical protein
LNRIIIFLLLEHYPFGKPVATFPDHALTLPGGGCLAQANSAIDPARAFTDDEGVVLHGFVALPGNDEKYGSIPLMAFGLVSSCVWPLAMNVRSRTYSRPAAAHDADAVAWPELGILGTFCANRNKCPGPGLALSG